MSFCYLASFDVSDPGNGFSTLQFSASGHSTFQVSIPQLRDAPAISGQFTTPIFNHYPGEGLGYTLSEDRRVPYQLGELGQDAFCAVVTDAIVSAAQSAGWGAAANTLSCTFSTNSLGYTFHYSGTFSVTFGNEATCTLFGFHNSGLLTVSGTNSVSSLQLPDYIINPTIKSVSDPTPNYEPDSITSQAVSGAGKTFSLSRSAVPLYRDWVQQYEPREYTLRLAATPSMQFTHQELFEACRGALPFVVIDGFGTGNHEVFLLRAEGSNFKPDRAAPGWDYFHITYKTIVQGIITGG